MLKVLTINRAKKVCPGRFLKLISHKTGDKKQEKYTVWFVNDGAGEDFPKTC